MIEVSIETLNTLCIFSGIGLGYLFYLLSITIENIVYNNKK